MMLYHMGDWMFGEGQRVWWLNGQERNDHAKAELSTKLNWATVNKAGH